MGRKPIVLVVLAVAAAALVAVALATRDGSSGKQPALRLPDAATRYGDDADLMRRLERKKLTTHSTR